MQLRVDFDRKWWAPPTQVTTAAGRQEQKEVLLEEHDGVWRELRDLHIADVWKLLYSWFHSSEVFGSWIPENPVLRLYGTSVYVNEINK